MSTVYILIGFTGSGKSTFARKFAAEHPNTKIVSPDGFRIMFNGEYKYLPELDDVITQSTFNTAQKLLNAGYDVIIDCGNLQNAPDRRAKWKQLLNENDITRFDYKPLRFVAVMMPMDKPVGWYVERRMKNPHWPVNVRQIIENEMKAYQPPDDDEFEEVIYIKENET